MQRNIPFDPQASLLELRSLLNQTGRAEGWAHNQAQLVDYVSEADLPEIFAACLSALLLSDDQAKEKGLLLEHECLSRLQWQAPELFYPHLAEMWRQRSPFWEGWWDSGKMGVDIVLSNLEAVAGETSQKHRWSIQFALERTNCTEAFQWLRENYGLTLLYDYAGVEYDGTEWCKLYYPAAYHFVFPPEYLDHPKWADHLKPTHPTWHLPAEFGEARLYDAFFPKKLDADPEYRLELLELPPEFHLTLPINFQAPQDSAPSETIVDLQGTILPYDLDLDDGETEEFHEALTFNPFLDAEFIPIRFARTPKRWYRQPDAYEQNRSKLGGMGVWRQPYGQFDGGLCSGCGVFAPLLLQLGDDALRTPFCMSSFFWCENCRRVTTISTYS